MAATVRPNLVGVSNQSLGGFMAFVNENDLFTDARLASIAGACLQLADSTQLLRNLLAIGIPGAIDYKDIPQFRAVRSDYLALKNFAVDIYSRREQGSSEEEPHEEEEPE